MIDWDKITPEWLEQLVIAEVRRISAPRLVVDNTLPGTTGASIRTFSNKKQ